MRIVLISTPIGFLGSGRGGGVELTLNSLVSGLLKRGHSVDVVAPKDSKLFESNKKANLHFVEGIEQISWQHQDYNSPEVGLTKPVIILAIVDLPEPDSPTTPSVSPSNNSNETSLTALTAFSSISFLL